MFIPEILLRISKEVGAPVSRVETTIKLLEEGGTVPFIARYRKEATGNLDEVKIRHIEEEANRLARIGPQQMLRGQSRGHMKTWTFAPLITRPQRHHRPPLRPQARPIRHQPMQQWRIDTYRQWPRAALRRPRRKRHLRSRQAAFKH